MNSEYDDQEAASQIEQFRRDAERLGFGRSADLFGANQLETSDDFILRMKSAATERRRPETKPRDKSSTRRWKTRPRMVAAAIAAAATAALVFGMGQFGDSPASADTPAVLDFEFASAVRIAYAPGTDPDSTLALLASAADADLRHGPAHQGPIQYKKSDNWYIENDDGKTSRIVPRVTETWLRPDGSLTTREAVGKPLTQDGRGATGSASRKAVSETLPPGTVDAAFAESLPLDPSRLSTALLVHSGCQSTELSDVRSMCLYREVVDLTETYVLPRGLTEAIWTMLRSEVGFRSLGTVKDRAGRDALGLSIIDSNRPTVRHLLLGDSDDGRIVGFEEILIKRDPDMDTRPPSVLSFSTVLKSERSTTVPE
ncbi:hypothetical protein [Aeromicrobium fastidiosum]|uniref:CU044_5270 family protein n=1 Tax=Aeromicrobium fastidiosum TaxID=52699 RepID=A0A641AMF9_9ACTN|nr:hypothetical protein [Aeromicrobium fastidiosum]KAA1374911.1 hypothetical protein ESP62_016200 [Aeromicrobium fastidiosum]MBP2390517.1 hypothetical protein [Aeromicrobium fastidiosum]